MIKHEDILHYTEKDLMIILSFVHEMTMRSILVQTGKPLVHPFCSCYSSMRGGFMSGSVRCVIHGKSMIQDLRGK